MRKLFIVISFTLFLSRVLAGNGDTIVVQAFTFGSPQDAWFVFPSDTMRFEKILMKYTLKCNSAQSPACGEWDYLTYTYLYKNTGGLDSSVIHQPTFLVNGNIADSVNYITSPSYTYLPSWQYFIQHLDTTSLVNTTIGTGTVASSAPFGTSEPASRCQFLWKASEMTTAGMTAGNISGLQFYVQTPGSELRNMTIRMKLVSVDSLSPANLTNTGMTTLYRKNTEFATSGWNSIPLTTPFNWNGTSNLLIEITFENTAAGTNNIIAGENTSFPSGLVNSGDDRVASFHSAGYIDVPLNNQLTALDSAVTVTFWTYGTPEFQPQDGTCFEAVDSVNNRVLNAHLPWSDSNVYWDAGFSGTAYDRINKAATTSQIEGQWNFWTFTKNVATGSMKVYLNGTLWHSGTGKTKTLENIKTFRIGKGNWSGSQTYEGRIDEFMVFSKELTPAEIMLLLQNKITPAHPQYNNMILYFPFNDGNNLTAQDDAPAGNLPAQLNGVSNPLKNGSDLVFGFTATTLRPNVIFEQGIFVSQMDSVLVIDTVINPPMQIITYTDSVNNPGMPVDTLIVWPLYYYNYVYNALGEAIDSTLSTPYETMHLEYYDYYQKFPQVLRYELARYITPYGNGLSLGTGWTWTFDVSDYRTLLADSVRLAAGNWQELLDMKFLFIKGTPPRDVIDIQNLYNGGFNYGLTSDPIENYLPEIEIDIPTNATNARWKSRITGHGMDSPSNCAEFCAKNHYFQVNGNTEFTKLVWRDNCDLNPLYPQGGTWVYDRTNWCPGAEVWTYDMDLSSFIVPGQSILLNHNVEPYTSGGPWDYYQIEDQLVTYGSPNFSLDASLEYIISPSADQMYMRLNPICTKPIIVIKNTGSTTLTSLTITYGINGATPSVYQWTGSLPFMESETVTLENFNWAESANKFTVTISNPNGGVDQYSYNNTKESAFAYVPSMPAQFIIEMRTNNYPYENQFTLKDSEGNIIVERSGMDANTVYRDTLDLVTGCYEFELTDSGEDGLNFWANTAQGAGTIRFRKLATVASLKNFNADFGGQVYQQFTVGLSNSMEEYITTQISTFSVSPNPASAIVYLNIDLNKRSNATVEIFSLLGKRVYVKDMGAIVSDRIEADISQFEKGVYIVKLTAGKDLITKKLIVQ